MLRTHPIATAALAALLLAAAPRAGADFQTRLSFPADALAGLDDPHGDLGDVFRLLRTGPPGLLTPPTSPESLLGRAAWFEALAFPPPGALSAASLRADAGAAVIRAADDDADPALLDTTFDIETSQPATASTGRPAGAPSAAAATEVSVSPAPSGLVLAASCLPLVALAYLLRPGKEEGEPRAAQRARREFRVRVVAVGLVALLVLGAGAWVLRGYRARSNVGALLRQADRARDGNDPARELVYLGEYVGQAPGDHDARARLALLLHGQARTTAQHKRVYYLLESVLRQRPDRDDLRRKIVETASALDQTTDALYHLQALNDKAGGKDADALEAMGDFERRRQAWGKAADLYARAARADPRRVSSYLRQALLLRDRLERPGEADRVIAAMMAANPDGPEAHIARARFARRGAAGDARATLRRSLEPMLGRHAGTHPELLLLAACLDAERGDLAAARGLLQQGRKLRPDAVAFPRELARLELHAGRRAEAAALLQAVADKLPPRSAEYRAAVELLVEAGEKGQARRLIADARGDGAAALADYLEARLAFAEGRWAEAVRLLDHARLGRGLPPELSGATHLLLARCHQRLGSPDLQLEAAQAALAADPVWPPGLAARASALAALGRVEEALSVYETIKDQMPAARLAAARLWLARNAALPPDRREWDPPLALLDGAPPALRDGPDAVALRGRLLAARGDRDAAREVLEAGCASHPNEVGPWLALADVSADRAAVLDRAEQALGDRVELRLARGRLDDAERDAAGRADWLRAVGDARLAGGDLAGADRAFTLLSQPRPHDLTVWSVRLDLAALLGSPEQADALARKLEELEGPDGTLWRYGRALHAATRGRPKDLADARRWLAEARKRRPGWGRPCALEGRLDEAEGKAEKAAENYQAALDRGEAGPELITRLVRLLYQRRNYAAAQAVLDKAQTGGRAGELGRLVVLTALLGGDHGPASLEAAARKVPAGSADPLDHILRGRLLAAAGRPAEAEAALRRAVDLDPRRPECHLALAGFLAEHSPAGVAGALARAERELPAAIAPLALAVCCEAAGQTEKAASHFRAALAGRPNDPAVLRAAALAHLRRGQLAAAEPTLRRLIAADRADPGSAGWARRALALALAGTGEYARQRQALALLDPNDAEDQRARAFVLARQPRDRREAIRALEASFARATPTPEEEFFLAALLLADGDWPRASEQLLFLLTSRQGESPAAIAFYVEQLARRDELAKAAHWPERLEAIEPGSPRALGCQARLLLAKSEPGAARRLLRDAAHTKDAARLLDLARRMESLGFHDDAEKAYRACAALPPGSTGSALPLVEFLGRRGRVGEALGLFGRMKDKAPDTRLAEAAVAVLRGGAPTEAQCRLVAGWLREARKGGANLNALDLALANVSDLGGDAAEAVAAYRDVLRRDGGDLVARNNLAVLLALGEGKHEEALGHIDQALGQAGPLPGLLDTRAIVHLAGGQPGLAAGDLERATRMAGGAAGYFRLASAYLKAGKLREARAAWEKAKDGGFALAGLHPLERPAARVAMARLEGNPESVQLGAPAVPIVTMLPRGAPGRSR